MDRRRVLIDEIRDFLGKSVSKCLFIPYANGEYLWRFSVEEYHELNFHAGYELDPIFKYEDPIKAVNEAEAFYVDGGNTYRLLNTLYQKGLIETLKKRIQEGVPYIGLSAGTNIVCPTIQTTNDMPIVMPPTLNAMGLLPFQVNTHFIDSSADQNMRTETRALRIQEFHEENDTMVVGLREGSILRVEGEKISLRGFAGACIFTKGQSPKDVLSDDPIDFLMR